MGKLATDLTNKKAPGLSPRLKEEYS